MFKQRAKNSSVVSKRVVHGLVSRGAISAITQGNSIQPGFDGVNDRRQLAGLYQD